MMEKETARSDHVPASTDQQVTLEKAGVIESAFDTDELAEDQGGQANGASMAPVGTPQEIDEEAIKTAVVMMLKAIGEDPTREGLRDTPRRIAEMYRELFSGLKRDPSEVLRVSFDEGHSEMVIVKDIPFYTVCEHHLLPFHGVAHVGYIPRGRVVGISKLARALEILARRPQLQERLTSQVADSIMTTLEPHGVGVVLEGEHLCYDRETEILTTQGWVRFDRLEKGVPVAQVNPQDLSLTFVEPLAYIQYPYQGTMLRWQSDTVDLCITPDHRVVMQSEWKFEHERAQAWEVMAARDLPARFYVPQAVKWDAPDIEPVSFAGEWYSKLQPEHRSEVPFDDEVFCVSVPTGALLVRRNGRPIVSGNCMTMRGVKKPGSRVVTSAMRGVFKNVATRSEFMALIRNDRR